MHVVAPAVIPAVVPTVAPAVVPTIVSTVTTQSEKIHHLFVLKYKETILRKTCVSSSLKFPISIHHYTLHRL